MAGVLVHGLRAIQHKHLGFEPRAGKRKKAHHLDRMHLAAEPSFAHTAAWHLMWPDLMHVDT
jgi:hypothetical protein